MMHPEHIGSLVESGAFLLAIQLPWLVWEAAREWITTDGEH